MNGKTVAPNAPVSTYASRVALGSMRDNLQTPTPTHINSVDSAALIQRLNLLDACRMVRFSARLASCLS
jgi:hypothetical protein